MKIEWLNPEMTRALLIRGRWWWKRVALVEYAGDGGARWEYDTGVSVESDLGDELSYLMVHAPIRRQRDAAWMKVCPLPKAVAR